MVDFLRRNLRFLLAFSVCLAVGLSAPAVAHGVQHAVFAHNSDKVDGKHAVGAGAGVNSRKGKLVATDGAGRLPANIVNQSVKSAELPGRFMTLSPSPSVVLQVPVTSGSECGSVTRHRFRVDGTGFFQAGTAALPRMSLVADSSSVAFGPGFTLASAPAGGYSTLAASRVIELAPGSHTIRMVADLFTGSGSIGDPSLIVTDLGWHCNGGSPKPLVKAPRTGGTPAG